jgi:hypothetical protein
MLHIDTKALAIPHCATTPMTSPTQMTPNIYKSTLFAGISMAFTACNAQDMKVENRAACHRETVVQTAVGPWTLPSPSCGEKAALCKTYYPEFDYYFGFRTPISSEFQQKIMK